MTSDEQVETHKVDTSETVTQPRPRKIAVSGAGGLIGAGVIDRMKSDGQSVIRLVRHAPKSAASEAQWNADDGLVDPSRLERVSAVVHLAGESIAEGRWSAEKKRRIRDSRVNGTEALCRSLAALPHKPRVLVCASAIGYYGDRGETVLDEQSDPGDGFLPEICQQWEQATAPAADAGIRVVNVRIGVVISKQGGALQKMLLPFKMGVGGKVGSGRQYWSWVAHTDVVGAILHALDCDELHGPVNVVSPHAVTNAEFTKALGEVLHRPTIFPMPVFAAKLALGEMAEALLLASAHVVPTRLQETGYQFAFPDLRDCLRHELNDQHS